MVDKSPSKVDAQPRAQTARETTPRRMLSMLVAVALLPLLAAAASGSALDLKAVDLIGVKCDSGKGYGDEEVYCTMECDAGDDIDAEVRVKNGDPNRLMYVEVECGDGFDNDLCSNTDMCRAEDTTSVGGAGHCSGWVDNEWNDYYKLALWCGSGGGKEAVDRAMDAMGRAVDEAGEDQDPCLNLDSTQHIVGSYRFGILEHTETGYQASAISLDDGECSMKPIQLTIQEGVLAFFIA